MGGEGEERGMGGRMRKRGDEEERGGSEGMRGWEGGWEGGGVREGE